MLHQRPLFSRVCGSEARLSSSTAPEMTLCWIATGLHDFGAFSRDEVTAAWSCLPASGIGQNQMWVLVIALGVWCDINWVVSWQIKAHCVYFQSMAHIKFCLRVGNVWSAHVISSCSSIFVLSRSSEFNQSTVPTRRRASRLQWATHSKLMASTCQAQALVFIERQVIAKNLY